MVISQTIKDTAFSILDKSKHRGFHCFRDLRFYSSEFNLSVETMFDVGANIGQTSKELRGFFPNAKIHAFEPIASTFEILKNNMAGIKENIVLNNFALGPEAKEIIIELSDNSLTNSLLREVTDNSQTKLTQTIKVINGDNYCELNDISSIYLLKTDTEGYDLDVLKGFEKMLANNSIRFILSEVTLDESDSAHTQFNELNRYLIEYGYKVSNFYDSIYYQGFSPNLYYCNCLWSLSLDRY
jgi:FkbM family methyltransferase